MFNNLHKVLAKPVTYTRICDKDKIVFRSGYPLTKNGLVRINQWKINEKSTKLVISSHKGKHLLITSVMNENDANEYCKWNPKSIIYVPWHVNTIQDVLNIKYSNNNGVLTAIQNEIVRGKNRLVFNLDHATDYHVMVPENTDIETDLQNTDVVYESSRATKLSVKCSSVNICGENGYSDNKIQEWDYYHFNKNILDPVTKIVTKGVVMIIDKK